MRPYSTTQMLQSAMDVMLDAHILRTMGALNPEETVEDLRKLKARSIDLAIANAKPAKVVEVVTPPTVMPVEGKLLNAPVADASENLKL